LVRDGKNGEMSGSTPLLTLKLSAKTFSDALHYHAFQSCDRILTTSI
jgi:hypothetical protein